MRFAVVVSPATVRNGRRFRAVIDGELPARGWKHIAVLVA